MRSLLAFVLLVGLAACSSPPAANNFPKLTYTHLSPIAFDVRQVDVVDGYAEPGAPPNVEHLIESTPARAISQWATDRLQAVGLNRILRFTVTDASIVETAIELKGGLEGLLTTEQSERYEGRLAVTVEIIADDGRREGSAEAIATRSITVPESASVAERERIWFGLTEKLVLDLDKQLETTLRQVFPRYLRS